MISWPVASRTLDFDFPNQQTIETLVVVPLMVGDAQTGTGI